MDAVDRFSKPGGAERCSQMGGNGCLKVCTACACNVVKSDPDSRTFITLEVPGSAGVADGVRCSIRFAYVVVVLFHRPLLQWSDRYMMQAQSMGFHRLSRRG